MYKESSFKDNPPFIVTFKRDIYLSALTGISFSAISILALYNIIEEQLFIVSNYEIGLVFGLVSFFTIIFVNFSNRIIMSKKVRSNWMFHNEIAVLLIIIFLVSGFNYLIFNIFSNNYSQAFNILYFFYSFIFTSSSAIIPVGLIISINYTRSFEKRGEGILCQDKNLLSISAIEDRKKLISR